MLQCRLRDSWYCLRCAHSGSSAYFTTLTKTVPGEPDLSARKSEQHGLGQSDRLLDEAIAIRSQSATTQVVLESVIG